MVDVFNMRERGYPWWLIFLQGITVLIIGLLLLFLTQGAFAVIVQLLGIYWLISGILSLVSIFVHRTGGGWKLVAGIVGIIGGLVVIRHPLWIALYGSIALFSFLAIVGIVYGAVDCILAFRGEFNPAVLANGIISLFFALILLFAAPLLALVLPFILGACGIIGGILLIVFAFTTRNASERSIEQTTGPQSI